MNLSPYIRFASDDKPSYPFHIKERIIFDYELLFIMEGQLTITVEDTVYDASAGDVFLFRPNRRHSMLCVSKTGFRQPHVHFDLIRQENSERVPICFKNYDELSAEERSMIRPDILLAEGIDLPDKLHIDDLNTFQNMLFQVIYEYENQLPFSNLSTQGAFLQLWAYVLRQHISSDAVGYFPHKNLMLDIRQYLNMNINSSISLDELAHQFNISKFHLSHTFKAMYGMSPIQYHLHCRLEKAKNLVFYTKRSITDIAAEVGYSSLNDFSRAFKKKYGVSPVDFRNDSHTDA